MNDLHSSNRAERIAELLTRATKPATRVPASKVGPQLMRLRHWLRVPTTADELRIAKLIDRSRPPSLRMFDQIPMNYRDHVRQGKLLAPYLADQTVAFMGDSDCTSLLLGLLSLLGMPLPSRMLLLDFDARLLKFATDLAESHGFGHILETRLYNVFDRLPNDLIGQFDWFYTNPPYGSHNLGDSARLFITRGCELVRPDGQGCIILPHDRQREWTRNAMLETQHFLTQHGWAVNDKVRELHTYKLDDDRRLASSVMLVEHVASMLHQPMPYGSRSVACEEIPLFYGRSVKPPYPHYICADGTFDEYWNSSKVHNHV
jgi:N4-bis(aminopropyl)spermidine synthase